MMLSGKKIVLGITGSIAAYKSVQLLRLLIKEGADVKVVITPAAKDFVSPLVLATLSKQVVASDFFKDSSWSNHVDIGRWADLMLIAPLSCNTLAKMANGICDNLLLSVYLSSICPVMVAPAMDEDMWKHPSTQRNIQTLKSYNNMIIPVGSGELASGLIGEGRMTEPEDIVNHVRRFFLTRKQFEGERVLVTAGPTYEPIDPVRFIGNYSSGKMGIAIADEFSKRGAEVILILGPSVQKIPENIRHVIRVRTADEMFDASIAHFENVRIAVLSAAVADFTPLAVAQEKIKKSNQTLTVELKKTKDILRSLGSIKKTSQLLVGFALETNNEKQNALEKLKSKNADLIVLNSLNDEGAGFGINTNKITIFDKKGNEYSFPVKDKAEVAGDIIDKIKTMINV
ncbi:MAG: bifunctional phosphopantothenoylcysteine decarboxylase/phosphopantothenate--cysteine ligase CoaBC [Lacibacter sp.]